MAIPQDLLEMLSLRRCAKPVKLLDDQSGLKVPRAAEVYPVRDDIPVMLRRSLEAKESDSRKENLLSALTSR